MLIEHDTVSKEVRVECDYCHRQWVFEEFEMILAPWPHVECPVCHQWISLF